MGVLQALNGSKYKCIDAHLHVVDFLQDTQGLRKCLKYMDKGNIAHACVFGLPVSKLWASWERTPPLYYLGDNSKCYYYSAVDTTIAREYQELEPESRQRFFPFIGGFNPCDKYAYKHIERVIKYFPNMWHGVGEILFRHDDLTNLTYGEPPRSNHPAMDSVFDLCAELEMPVCIHQNVTDVGTSTYPGWLYELEETLQKHSRVTFVWCHCGVSRRVYSPIYFQIVKRLLDRYDNLSVDIAWVVFDDFICPNGKPDEDWLQLSEDYSDRICIGTDVVNKFQFLPATIQRYDVFLDALSEKAAKNLAFNTAYNLFSKVRA
ncbi:amidohydrolase family protein [Aetokthonos hydrillicola Thurmond2011]|jgi:hypothetical protein|uniref:Amidohydrolase family protein n=1 Tax=Aetokthonos hydrillicola Thurmond2011 TaxID=2712845 RepID=A0AAP5I6N8_9CYAN|nr:amidohydrolase family protein [Aetokthonos hydrillicola]MBO3457674.1 amidohydrolase family protein [Aetokthonos hydrillicola CCALA 1050]MBW4587953.1 amidohydrolase family protein [Aetokthonos hydrillicola CCALA 1050]MDR9894642.1 amidohydrolase family protein [Aetokthonos hydrillicola Thurmond2011]